MPHLTRSLKIWARIQSVRLTNSSLAVALDLLNYSVIIVDAEARILHANRSAEQLLSGRDMVGGDSVVAFAVATTIRTRCSEKRFTTLLG